MFTPFLLWFCCNFLFSEVKLCDYPTPILKPADSNPQVPFSTKNRLKVRFDGKFSPKNAEKCRNYILFFHINPKPSHQIEVFHIILWKTHGIKVGMTSAGLQPNRQYPIKKTSLPVCPVKRVHIGLARWPGQLSLSENMEVKMLYCLKSVFTVVAYHSVAVFKSQL